MSAIYSFIHSFISLFSYLGYQQIECNHEQARENTQINLVISSIFHLHPSPLAVV